MKLPILTLTLSCCLISHSLMAREVRLADCPQAVQNTIQREKGSGRIDEIDFKAGRNIYVVEIDGTGTNDLELTIAANGNLKKVEEDIPTSKLPAAVRNAIREISPNGRIDDADRITVPGKITYRVEIEEPGDRDLVVLLNRSGKVLSKKRTD